ncbi:MAG: low molecular weight protein-tyrosine-phosphatase [Candidatus Cyclobacteriaceae bacterium M3_2C_046]
MIKVLFVCLGNICRSPLAEAIFIKQIKERGWEKKFRVDSAGTSNYHIGDEPDQRTFEVAEKNGLTLDHLGRQIKIEDFRDYDYILAMDQSNYDDIMSYKAYVAKGIQLPEIHLMRKFENDGSQKDVPDPYFGGSRGFQEVYDILERTIANFLDYLQEKHPL